MLIAPCECMLIAPVHPAEWAVRRRGGRRCRRAALPLPARGRAPAHTRLSHRDLDQGGAAAHASQHVGPSCGRCLLWLGRPAVCTRRDLLPAPSGAPTVPGPPAALPRDEAAARRAQASRLATHLRSRARLRRRAAAAALQPPHPQWRRRAGRAGRRAGQLRRGRRVAARLPIGRGRVGLRRPRRRR